jgi:WD40 repeat protein
MKEHQTQVNHIRINKDDDECVSCSDDGTVYTWVCYAFKFIKHTTFKDVDYSPDCTQIVVAGGDLLRELTVSEKEVNGMMR